MLRQDAQHLREALVLHGRGALGGGAAARRGAVRGVVRLAAEAVQPLAVAAGEGEGELAGDQVGAGLHRIHTQRPAEGQQVVGGRHRHAASPRRLKAAEERTALARHAAAPLHYARNEEGLEQSVCHVADASA